MTRRQWPDEDAVRDDAKLIPTIYDSVVQMTIKKGQVKSQANIFLKDQIVAIIPADSVTAFSHVLHSAVVLSSPHLRTMLRSWADGEREEREAVVESGIHGFDMHATLIWHVIDKICKHFPPSNKTFDFQDHRAILLEAFFFFMDFGVLAKTRPLRQQVVAKMFTVTGDKYGTGVSFFLLYPGRMPDTEKKRNKYTRGTSRISLRKAPSMACLAT